MNAPPRELALRQVQEGLSLYWHRPPGRWIARLLVNTPVTPIHVTYAAGLAGIIAGILLVAGAANPPLRVAGGVMLMLSCILDCADGELARARKKYSLIGTLLDGLTDNVVGTSVFFGMAYDVVVYTGNPWFWILGVGAGLSAAAHVWVFDATKKQYLNCLGLAHPEEVQPVSSVIAQQHEAERAGRWFDAILLRAFVFFRRTQSVGVTSTEASDRLRFWQDNKRRMMNWTYMASSIHFFSLYVAAIVSPFWPPALLACTIFYAGVLNLGFVVLLMGRWKAN